MSAVFPIGHYMGPQHPRGAHVVRIGRAHLTLSETEFDVWVRAHAGPVDDAEVVADLADRGALAVVEPGAEARFLETYRMDALQVGVGNSAGEPDVFLVGIAEPVALGRGSYELWQWGGLAPTLMGARAVLDDLRVLLAHGCAYLDVARATTASRG
jgi:hypothetical protein